MAILNVLHLPIDSAVRHAARVRYLSSFSSVFDWLASASGSYFPTLLDWSHDCGDFVSGDADALALAAAFGCGGDIEAARRFVSENCAALISAAATYRGASSFEAAVNRSVSLEVCGDLAAGRVDARSVFPLVDLWALWLTYPARVRALSSHGSTSAPSMVSDAIRSACTAWLS